MTPERMTPEQTCGKLGLHIDVPGDACNAPGTGQDTSEVPDMRHCTHNPPRPRNRYSVPWRNDPRPNPALRHTNLAFGWPACFEDCCALGLDPYTGEAA